MITRLSHSTVFVTDQDVAKDFYVNKLGFNVSMDFDMGGWRWLTVTAPNQPDLNLILMPIMTGEWLSEEDAQKIRELVKAGKMPTGVMHTEDCHKTYEELKAKGVEFAREPTDQFYGIEALMLDPFGNWYSLTQPKQMG